MAMPPSRSPAHTQSPPASPKQRNRYPCDHCKRSRVKCVTKTGPNCELCIKRQRECTRELTTLSHHRARLVTDNKFFHYQQDSGTWQRAGSSTQIGVGVGPGASDPTSVSQSHAIEGPSEHDGDQSGYSQQQYEPNGERPYLDIRDGRAISYIHWCDDGLYVGLKYTDTQGNPIKDIPRIQKLSTSIYHLQGLTQSQPYLGVPEHDPVFHAGQSSGGRSSSTITENPLIPTQIMIQGYTGAVSLPTEYPYFGEQSPEYQFPDIFGQQSTEYGPYMPGAR